MDVLPSYQEATTRIDWIQLVAPYVQSPDFHSLCLVSRRFWRIFAPNLWVNLLQAVRCRGLDPSDGKYFCTRLIAYAVEELSASGKNGVADF